MESLKKRLIKEAKAGDVQAQYLLGHSYVNGSEGFSKSYKKALKWYTKAAENGHADAYRQIEFLKMNKFLFKRPFI
jgi:hypothetical protein